MKSCNLLSTWWLKRYRTMLGWNGSCSRSCISFLNSSPDMSRSSMRNSFMAHPQPSTYAANTLAKLPPVSASRSVTSTLVRFSVIFRFFFFLLPPLLAEAAVGVLTSLCSASSAFSRSFSASNAMMRCVSILVTSLLLASTLLTCRFSCSWMPPGRLGDCTTRVWLPFFSRFMAGREGVRREGGVPGGVSTIWPSVLGLAADIMDVKSTVLRPCALRMRDASRGVQRTDVGVGGDCSVGSEMLMLREGRPMLTLSASFFFKNFDNRDDFSGESVLCCISFSSIANR
mmetsp:Transcript_49787/g.125171  ORF Transcript_49787/g.125171 Transcript_49787/m.125171 type:complete len:286 (+) Transcript_49787:769-1626(+)